MLLRELHLCIPLMRFKLITFIELDLALALNCVVAQANVDSENKLNQTMAQAVV